MPRVTKCRTTKAELREDRTRKKMDNGPTVYDRDQILKELFEWVEEEDSLTMTGFCSKYGYTAKMIWRFEQESEKFEDAMQLVKMKIADRREKLCNSGDINYGIWFRYQKSFDPFLKRDEDEDLDKAAKRRSGIADKEQANLVMIASLASQGKIKQK